MHHEKFRLPGLQLERQFIPGLVLLLIAGFGLIEATVAKRADCSTKSAFPHHHPELWLLVSITFLSYAAIILWRSHALKQLQQLQNTQVILHSFNAELSREIRERQKVEQKLRRSEAKLAEAQHIAHIGSWDLDLKTEKITWSEELFAIFGCDPTQPEPTYAELMQRVYPADRIAWQQAVEQAIATGQSYTVDHRILFPDGSIRYIEGRGAAEVDRHGQVVRLFGTSMDITERKCTEAALRESEERFRAVFEQAAVGICVDTLEGEALQMNQKFCDITGYSAAEIRSAHWSEITHPDDRAVDWSGMHQLLAGEIEHFSIEKRYFRPDQSLVWVNLTVSLIHNATEAPQNVLVIIQDISEAKQLAAERQQAEMALRKSEERFNRELLAHTRQLEATNRELESFSYSVSHDLRAPSRHIHGFVNVLRQYLEQQHLAQQSVNPQHSISPNPRVDTKVAHYLDVIEASSRKMGLLIDGLLTLSRVGRRQMESRPVVLSTLVNEAIESAKIDSEGRQAIEFRVGNLPIVNGDAVLLQQVLINLISNGIKFSRNTDAPYIEIGSLPDQTVFVRDNGIGFAMDDAEHIFDAFQRLHGREFEGTGIGLAIVQRIIHRHNGNIWAESQPNQGATFYFQLGQSHPH